MTKLYCCNLARNCSIIYSIICSINWLLYFCVMIQVKNLMLGAYQYLHHDIPV